MEGGGVQLGQWKPVDDLHQQAEAHWELKAEKSLWKHRRTISKKTLKNNLQENIKENIEEHFQHKCIITGHENIEHIEHFQHKCIGLPSWKPTENQKQRTA